MCGINGFLDLKNIHNKDEALNIIKIMNSKVLNRGPDDTGEWGDERQGVYLGHQRLSILDLSISGHQPMTTELNRYHIVFNGEIYNHLELRSALEDLSNKVIWKGSSDTETLIRCFEAFGIEKTLQLIDGMFAMAIWDSRVNKLFLVRDRFGEKPLYCSKWNPSNSYFLFSSDLNALTSHLGFSSTVDRYSLSSYMKSGYIPRDRSIYSEVQKVLPGTMMEIDLSTKNVRTKVFWDSIEQAEESLDNKFQGSKSDALDSLEALLKKKVSNQMLSDVPLGSFLSGGIDSSLITCIMQSVSKDPITTFTIGFEEDHWDEAGYAKEISERLGTNHIETYINYNDALQEIPSLGSVYSEPFADSSQIPTMVVSKIAKQHVTVALSGDGGDEVFGGYSRYFLAQKIWSILSFIPGPLKKAVRTLLLKKTASQINNIFNLIKLSSRVNSGEEIGDKILKGLNLLPAESYESMYKRLNSIWDETESLVLNSGSYQEELNFNIFPSSLGNIEKSMLYDTVSYLSEDILVKVDRASMAYSLETRIPFLDAEIFKFAWSLPLSMKLDKNKGKLILKDLLVRFLPEDLFNRPKKGFSVPLAHWLRGPLKDWAESLLQKDRIEEEGYFCYELVDRTWKEHLSGTRNWQSRIWTILMFQSWLEENKFKIKSP